MLAKLRKNLDLAKPIANKQFALIRRSQVDIQVHLFDDGIAVDALDYTAQMIVSNKDKTWQKTIDGDFLSENIVQIPITDNDLIFSGNHNYEIRIIYDNQNIINIFGILTIHDNAAGDGGLPDPEQILDWSLYTSMLNLLTDGPYVAGDNIDFEVLADGRIRIHADEQSVTTDDVVDLSDFNEQNVTDALNVIFTQLNEFDSHANDSTIHFTQGQISITESQISDLDKYTQLQVDNLLNDKADDSDLSAHVNDSTIHFTESSIDHTNIQNIGINTHAQIDTHISDSTIHFTQAQISITESQISDLDKYTQLQVDNLLGDYVPYTGATSDVDLSNVNLTAPNINGVDNISFDNNATIDDFFGLFQITKDSDLSIDMGYDQIGLIAGSVTIKAENVDFDGNHGKSAQIIGGELLLDTNKYLGWMYSAETKISDGLFSGDWTFEDDVIVNGNVGIGTTSPSEKLHVAGTGLFEDDVEFQGFVGMGVSNPDEILTIGGANTRSIKLVTTSDANYRTLLTNYYSSSLGTALTGNGLNIFRHGISSGTRLNFTNGEMTFDYRNAVLMTLKGNGNLGIGTTSPSEKLHVDGNILADSYIKSGATDDDVLLGDGSTISKGDIGGGGATATLYSDSVLVEYNHTGPLVSNVVITVPSDLADKDTIKIYLAQGNPEGGGADMDDFSLKLDGNKIWNNVYSSQETDEIVVGTRGAITKTDYRASNAADNSTSINFVSGSTTTTGKLSTYASKDLIFDFSDCMTQNSTIRSFDLMIRVLLIKGV